MLDDIKMGDIRDFSNFVGAVIDGSSFRKLQDVIEKGKAEAGTEIVFGGGCDDSKGYFIEPTVMQVTNPDHDGLKTEYFGPILTVFVYEDERFEEVLDLCEAGFAVCAHRFDLRDRRAAVQEAMETLRFAAGNFYINDKPTGAVVGQQPFGGSRASGTNDKAGSILNLLRWVSPRTIKETFVPPRDYRYPFLG